MANQFYSLLVIIMTGVKLGFLVFHLIGMAQVVRAEQGQRKLNGHMYLEDNNMAQIHKLESQWEVKCSADNCYGMYTHNVTQLPKYVPQIYESIKVIEGDGVSVGTVRLWKYAIEGGHLAVKERTTAVDKGSRSITFDMFEGEVMKHYKTFVMKLAVTPKDEGSLVKWSLEFEKAHDGVPTPTAYMNVLDIINKELGRKLN